jgi:hypothetical protein
MKLVKLDNGKFRIEDGAVVIEASWPQIRAQMLYEFEIDPAEIDRAIEDMREKGHDVADFGIAGVFILSYASNLERKVKAELKAIQSVRREFHAAQTRERNGPEAKQAFDRLMHLYFTQDVDGNLLLLGELSYVEAA